MATRFAISSGNFNNTAIWDNGAVPLSTDDIYANGFSIAVNQNINAVSLRSTTPNVYLPAMPIPAMTGNTLPSGVCFSTQNPSQAYLAFNQAGSTWSSLVANVGTIGYTFTSTKYIVRYTFKSQAGQEPTNWTFQGSNDNFATAGVILHTGTTGGSNFVSPLFTNTVGYISYRLVVTTCSGNNICQIRQFEMTENAATTYGAATGGSFAITDSKDITLSGTQGLFSGSGSVYVLNVNTVSPNVVNINCGTNFLSYLATGEGSAFYLTIAGSGTTNITGNVYRTMNGIVSSATTGTVNINGNITSGFRGSVPVGCVILGGSATYNIIGNLSGDPLQTGTALNNAVTYSGSGTLNITGTISGNLTPACSFSGTGIINISGTITASSTREAINGGSSFVNILTGTITAGTGNNAIISTGSTLITVGNSPLINTNNNLAIFSPRIIINNTGVSQWRFQNQAGANVTIYSGTGAGMGYPAVDTVRYGSPTFGPTNTEYNGTMRIPDVTNVNKGVEYGYNLVGTAVLTAEDFLNAISTSTNPMAIRLTNLSTTQTMGDQLSGFSNA